MLSWNPWTCGRMQYIVLPALFVLFKLDVPLDLQQFTTLVPGEITYEGTKLLTQFYVYDYRMTTANRNNTLKVELLLQRIFLYHLTNTYLPTISLMVKKVLIRFQGLEGFMNGFKQIIPLLLKKRVKTGGQTSKTLQLSV